MYPAAWHKAFGDKTGHSAKTILCHLFETFNISSTFELGCGNAHWTQACIELGITDYLVADGPWNDRKDLLVDPNRFLTVNLDNSFQPDRKFDLTICLEVAEHVAEQYADNVVDTLTSSADIILFSAAIPLQGGYGHINEQWPSWWRERFAPRGFVPFDLIRPKFWRDDSLHYWYRQNCFVYVRESNLDVMHRATEAQGNVYRIPAMFDAVHPEKFEEVGALSFARAKRVIKRLRR